MSVEAVPARPVMANGKLYHSPLGLFPFQADCVARAFFQDGLLGVLDTGLGKTHVSMALGAALIEADVIDMVMHIAQRNKVDRDEFPAEWAQYTTLTTLTYHGSGRVKRLAKHGIPDVLITTYETGRDELVVKTGKSGRGRGDGPLVETLGLRGKRVLWIFDEVAKLGNRGSQLYRAYEHELNAERKGPHPPRVLGLSATPMSTDYEQPFNIGRIVWPARMPSVGTFEGEYTYGRDERGKLLYKRGAREWFATQFEPLIFRKRRTDPDVVDQMPALLEKAVYVDLEAAHAKLYTAVGDLYGENPQDLPLHQQDQLTMALKLTAGHPRAHLRSTSVLSTAIVAALGEENLRAIPSSKTIRLIEVLNLLKEQGEQAIVFTFYAETVLPEVVADLRAAGLKVDTYTGGQSSAYNEAAKAAFRRHEVDVLVSSDAGSKGLNLPEAGYVIEYETARTYADRTQRFGRGLRINSTAAHVYGLTMVARKTVEVGSLQSVLARNSLQDQLLGDVGAEGHVDAKMRRVALGR